MANPQREDGHVDIANELVEVLAKTYLSSYESQVLWAIFRKTYGWQKKEDWITGSQLVEMTGIAKGHISRTLKKLINRNMINRNGKKLSFQKNYDKWQKLPKQVTIKKLPIQDKKLPKQVTEVTQTGNKKLPKQVNTKETKRNYTKETIQKKGDIFLKAWKDFKEMRKKNNKNKPMTLRAEEMILNKLNKLSTNEKEQINILNESTMNDWKSVYPLKERFKESELEYQKYKPKKISKEEMEKNKQNVTKSRKYFLDIIKKKREKN